MKNSIQTVTGTLTILRREKNSLNGNPRYLCMVDDKVFYTKVDSMHGYGISNFDGELVAVDLQMHYNKLSLINIEAV